MGADGPGRQPDVDEEFARIVAGWSEVASTSGSSAIPRTPSPEPPVEPPAGPVDAPRAAEAPRRKGREPDDDAGASESTPPGSTLPAATLPAATSDHGTADTPGDDGTNDTRRDDGVTSTPPGPRGADDVPPLEASALWRGYVPEEPDEHFEPPEPHLPPAHDATYWLAVIGLVGGPLLILWAIVLSSNPDPGWAVVAGILLTLGGFGLLVLRGSGERDPDDDGSRI